MNERRHFPDGGSGARLDAPHSLRRSEFYVSGMDCADEVASLRTALTRLHGVRSVEADPTAKRLVVDSSAEGPSEEHFIRCIAALGMKARAWRRSDENADTKQSRRWFTTSFGGAAWLVGLAVSLVGHENIASILAEGGRHDRHIGLAAKVLYGVSIVASGWMVAPKALSACRRLRPDMNLLMVCAVAGAIGIGEWFEAATVTLLFSVSLSLESWSVARARRAVEALLAVAPSVAKVLRDSSATDFESRLVGEVAVGSRILIGPGDQVALDGVVESGRSFLDESSITGESSPREKGVGDEVFGGSINGDGTIVVRTTREPDETLVARIVRSVADARTRRGEVQRFVDRFAAVYTPIVLLLSILVSTAVPLAANGDWRLWFYRGLVFLVVACPCALVISTPVSIVCALARAARNGVLIKGAEFVEQLAAVKAIAFDKTGTLTVGRPTVTDLIAASGVDEVELLRVASAVEVGSSHPIAAAITKHASASGIRPAAVESRAILQGRGATAHILGEVAWVGSHRFLEEVALESAWMHKVLIDLESQGRTIAVVVLGKRVLGAIGLADTARSEARGAIESLRRDGIAHAVMLTGDHRGAATRIAAEVGIGDVRYGLLPGEKVMNLEAMLRTWPTVAMVGDGVNDAPSLARSSVGIAMGISGSGAAIETSDVTLMREDLRLIPWSVRFSRRTLAVIRFNISASLGVKAVVVLLTFFDLVSLWSAIAADMGVSLVVVANALRLLKEAAPDSRTD